MLISECVGRLESRRSHKPWAVPSRCSAILAAFIVVAFSLPCHGEDGILAIHVGTIKGEAIPGVILAVKGQGTSAPPTDSTGRTRIRLASATRPGDRVSLQIVQAKGKAGSSAWTFLGDETIIVPSFENESDNFVSITLLRREDRAMLENSEILTNMLIRTLRQNSPELMREESDESRYKKFKERMAAEFGLPTSEMDAALRKLQGSAKDPFESGSVSLYQEDFDKAAEFLRESIRIRGEALRESQSKYADSNFFFGQALYGQGEYLKAADAFTEALDLRAEDPFILQYLGAALLSAGKLTEAESALEKSLEIGRARFGQFDPFIAESLTNLAALRQEMEDFDKAEDLLQAALHIEKTSLGPEHPQVAVTKGLLAKLYLEQGLLDKSAPLFQEALDINKKSREAKRLDTAWLRHHLGLLYAQQSKFEQAEAEYLEALDVRAKALGEHHPDVAATLVNLAHLYTEMGLYGKAEPFYLRALQAFEKSKGPEHQDIAATLNAFGLFYQEIGNKEAAESMYSRSLLMREHLLGPDHLDVASSLSNLALLYQEQDKSDKAEPLLVRALSIAEKKLGPDALLTATISNNLALGFYHQGRYAEAEPLLRKSLKIREQNLGEESVGAAQILDVLAGVVAALGRAGEAETLYVKTIAIFERNKHKDIAFTLNNLAKNRVGQGKYDLALPLYEKALALFEDQFGHCHPYVAAVLTNYASALTLIGRATEASPFQLRAQRITAGECRSVP